MIVVAWPRQQRRVLGQQLLQTLDVVVVNHASSLRGCPLQTAAEAFAHLGCQVLPANAPVLPRQHELSVALRHGKGDVWQMRPRTRDGCGVTGSDVARELLGLLTERFERRTGGERLRRGHGDPLSSIACAPLKPG